MSTCGNCGAANPDGQRFCGDCGTQLVATCSACGHANPPGQRFCGNCGTALGGAAPEPAPVATPEAATPVAERRLVTVLFADLVGFTSASEGRDAEVTRDLLSRYFETARTVIARYGGVVEKFIGDAVMAVWGTPVATEDDAERAVRAALDFVAAIPELEPALRVRAGVLTGEAAVTLGAEGQGMVAGDLVNTAARIQSAAQPGSVFVGDATRRATESSIAFEDAGDHAAKGKAEPLRLHRAVRVVSGVGGTLRSNGLESPFVGRNAELTLIKNLFHGSADERRAHLVSVTGVAGIGKSRLLWEFYKYFDGIVDSVYWHRGRCLAYGEGVAYWALADMVRMRCTIGEDDTAEEARAKLRAKLGEHVPDEEERAFVEPALAHLLALEDAPPGDKSDLFAAWRLFFERLTDRYPVVLAFEDVQWADMGLLDFIEHLLEWCSQRPLFVLTLGRPELLERRPAWGAGQRAFSSLYVEPLGDEAMEQCLDGLVPGLPDEARSQILARAQGIPLYAMETVRMLLDQGVLLQEGSVYRLTQELTTLEVPETLHALIAARLDGLAPGERQVVQDAAVLGKTFTLPVLAAVARRPEAQLEPILAALARKEILVLQSDPRSPERGHYAFLQDLVRHVAYETLSRRDRSARHRAAAAHLAEIFDPDEIAEVLAAHYVAAVDAQPDADDADEVRRQACAMLARAGERAGSLGAPQEGGRYYLQAAELSDDPIERASLQQEAGNLALAAGDSERARELLGQAAAAFRDAGDARRWALASTGLGHVASFDGRLGEAEASLREAIAQLDEGPPTPELGQALAALGRILMTAGDAEASLAPLERALALAERFGRADILADALTTRGASLSFVNRPREARVLLEAAVAVCQAEGLASRELRTVNNLVAITENADRFAEMCDLGVRLEELARRQGDRRWETTARTGSFTAFWLLGRWDEVLETAGALAEGATGVARANLVDAARIHVDRGELDAAAAWVAATHEDDGADSVFATAQNSTRARLLRAQGRPAEALELAEAALAAFADSPGDVFHKLAFVEAVEAALACGDLDAAERLLTADESLDPGIITPFLEANLLRLRATLNVLRGDDDGVAQRFRAASDLLAGMSLVFPLAVTRLEHAEWLMSAGRRDDADPLLAEARSTFAELRATPWLERVEAAAGVSSPTS